MSSVVIREVLTASQTVKRRAKDNLLGGAKYLHTC